MAIDRDTDYLISILQELRTFPAETEWVEFKLNKHAPEEIGEYISALSNSAALLNKTNGYLVWGIDNETHNIVGTSFKPNLEKKGNEELENWLLRLLSPKIDFNFNSFEVAGKSIVMLEIKAACRHPVQFNGTEYIRVGSYKKKLKEFPEKERELWRIFDRVSFEEEIAAENVSAEGVLQLLNYPIYFEQLSLPLPDGRQSILEALKMDNFISRSKGGK